MYVINEVQKSSLKTFGNLFSPLFLLTRAAAVSKPFYRIMAIHMACLLVLVTRSGSWFVLSHTRYCLGNHDWAEEKVEEIVL